jgi:sulfoxide reductase catalytic subunit YedY
MQYVKDRGFVHPAASEITPRAVFEARRALLKGLAAGAGLATLPAMAQVARPGRLAALPGARSAVAGAMTMEKPTAYNDVTAYNNFYEFGTDKADPARRAETLKPRPWTVAVEGEVKKPGSYDLDSLLKLATQEERIYRLRCVEGWSMVIPWVGYSLSELVKRVEPTGNAKFVQFVTLADRAQMPGLRSSVLDWPYAEGLRLDEAMHPLAMLAFGLYGEVLPNQNGAPVRLVGQVDRQDPLRRQAAEDQLGAGSVERVRLLLERQPEGRPPALEPGQRAPDRRRRPVREAAPDADVQRLRVAGRAALCRHGPGQVLLRAPSVAAR